MPYRVLLFDLFGTVVHFVARVPFVRVAGGEHRSPLHWLQSQVQSELPDVPFEEFLAAIAAVTEEIIRARPPEYLEVSSRERFRRTLLRLGWRGPDPTTVAERLSLVHMAHLAERTAMPPEHGPLLRTLAERYPLGLVSNFDHGPTAHAILRRDGLDTLFTATVISADFGRRKPHPAIFQAAVRQLGAEPAEALYVGDTVTDDVDGAHAAGLDVVWINPDGAEVPHGHAAPTFSISSLTELPGVLASI